MANKIFWLAILVFGLFLSSCDLNNGDSNNNHSNSSYTIEFKIENHGHSSGGPVTKIEFINGENSDDLVLQTQNVNIAEGETSEIFKVSGFNNTFGNDDPWTYIRIGVRLTYNNDVSDTVFFSNFFTTKNCGKILIQSTAYFNANFLNFSTGDW